MSLPPVPALIEVEDLAARLASPRPPHLLDVRWALGDPQGQQHYLDEHLPGAVYVDLETELSRTGAPEQGRHPLPYEADFQAAARRWGIRNGDTVVVYDDSRGTSAARAWWLLRHGGVRDTVILNGGLAAWRAADQPVVSGAVDPEPGDVTVSFGAMAVATDDEAADAGRRHVLLDARTAERYRGQDEPVDPKAGHIPGAISLPTAGNLDAEGRFLPPEAIMSRINAHVADPAAAAPGERVTVYCGSGVTAAHEVAALASAGVDAALYPGSWSAWSNQDRPVARGPEPGA